MNEEDFFGELKSHVAKEVLTSLKEHQVYKINNNNNNNNALRPDWII